MCGAVTGDDVAKTLGHSFDVTYLRWCSVDEAKTWPEGIQVLERRTFDDEVSYEFDPYFRPDWMAFKDRAEYLSHWAKLQ